MGVDIAFWVEAKIQDTWVRLHLNLPGMESNPEDRYDFIYSGVRYYRFEPFIIDNRNLVNRDDLSSELASKVAGFDSFGVVAYSDLVEYLKEKERSFFVRLAKAGMYRFKAQLDRIEAMVVSMLPSSPKYRKPKDEERGFDDDYDGMQPDELYDEFKDENYCLFTLRDMVGGVLALHGDSLKSCDIRLVYVIC